MMLRIKKRDTIFYLYCVIVFCLTCYAVNAWFGTSVWYLALVAGIVTPLIISPQFFNTKTFVLFILYFIVVMMNYLSGDELYVSYRIKYIIQETASLFITITMTYYVLKNQRYYLAYFILVIVSVILVWNAIATQIADIAQPGIVRLANSELIMGESAASFMSLYAMGMTDYIMPHSAPILIPLAVMLIKDRSNKKNTRIVGGLLLYSLLALVFFSGATGPMLVAIIVTIMSFVVGKNGLKNNIQKLVIIFIISLPFIMNDTLMINLLDFLNDTLGTESYFHGKILAFQDQIRYGESTGDVAERGDLYSKSLMTFLTHPILGAQHGAGGHSVMLDWLAALGLVGFVPFVLMLFHSIKFSLRYIGRNSRIYYMIGIIGAFLMLLTKGVSLWYMWFFLITVLPLGVIVIDKGLNNISKYSR